MKRVIFTIATICLVSLALASDIKVYKYGQFGTQKEIGKYSTDVRGTTTYQQKTKFGGYEKKRVYETDYMGNTVVYEINRFGGRTKIGIIKK